MTKVTKAYISFFIIYIFLQIPSSIFGQIKFQNPSFEDRPADATTPMGWLPCAEYTTPDILPGYWGVYNEPAEGNTFVGMITRENSTFESISTRLSDDLEAGRCYRYAMDLAKSMTYTGYNKSIKVRIWIGENKCDKDQMIYETDFIENSDWETHAFEFEPESDSRYILIEAFYKKGRYSHKGNVLMDNIRPIVNCNRA